MEALKSSCSKAIVDRVGSSSSQRGATAIHFSERLEFCFSRNDKVGNFRFLQMVHNKGIHPVHAVPSKTQVDLEAVEPQDQQTKETKLVRVKFQLQKDCKFGEQFLIVGDDPIVGAWDPSEALPMTWSEGHLWSIELDMPAGRPIQFKFILKGIEGNIVWQPGSDRIIHAWETMNRLTVCEDWENAELQKIIEEEQISDSNEKLQIDSEMPTFPEEEMVSTAAKASVFEDSQPYPEEKPLAEPDLQQVIGDSTSSSMEKPRAIVAENIGSSGDLMKRTSPRRAKNNMALENEKHVVSPIKDTIIHDLGHNGKVAPVNNQGNKVVEGNLFDFKGGPVLVPGLTPSVVPTGEIAQGEVEERMTIETSIGAFELEDQNMPEFIEEKESDDGTPQETSATLNNESDDGTPQETGAALNNEPDDGTPQETSATLSNEPDDGTPQETSATLNNEPDDGIPQETSATLNDEPDDGTPQETGATLNNEPDDGTPQETSATLNNEPDDGTPQETAATLNREPDDGTPQETSATINNEAELLHNEYEEKSHFITAMDHEMSDSHEVDENVLQNDIHWGREILKKFLTNFGLV